jgi:hypothetical protein
MRVAYADPPYVGCAHRYPENEEVDHAALIARLSDDFPDGWALSCHSPSLRLLLPLCPEDVRVLAWCKPFVPMKPNVPVVYAWEPVIVRGGRKRTRQQLSVFDLIACHSTKGFKVLGQKPDAFCFWLFEVLNLQPGDELVDLYPGSGAVTRAWQRWQHRLPLTIPA